MRLPEAPANEGPSPGSFLRAVRWLYHFHFQDERRERLFLASVGFLLSRSAFRSFKQRLDYSEYGGAPMLGVKGCVIICHGRSSAKAIKNAIRFAAEFSRQGLAERIQSSIADLHSREASLAKA